jgi:hypothetical protein
MSRYEETTKENFHRCLRTNERYLNTGCTTTYDSVENITLWIVAGLTFGMSGGRIGESTFYKVNKEFA